MKGITPIIAIIIILLITIAIAGAAYAYVSLIWGGVTQGFQILSTDCNAGTATFQIRNAGTKAIANASITVTRTQPTTLVLTAGDIDDSNHDGNIVMGEVATVTDSTCSSGNVCIYKILAVGIVTETYVQC